jgi:Spy/CpxP family protein refolding chaperone
MKTLNIVLFAASLLAVSAPAMANDDDSPSYKEQMTNLWISTGDANFARQAGLTEEQIQKAAHLPVERSGLN